VRRGWGSLRESATVAAAGWLAGQIGVIIRVGGGVILRLRQARTVVRPATLAEAWRARDELGSAARFLGGGVDLALLAPSGVTTLIDLSRLDLSYIRTAGEWLRIGATTTMTAAIESPQVGAHAQGFLRDVLRQVASPLQRNSATLGGTLARAHPWSDVIPALLVLDAELLLYDGAESTLSLERFLEERGKSGAPLIAEIRLPTAPEGSRGAFVKFARTAFDVGMLNVACLGAIEQQNWTGVRIAIGGTPARATRLRAVEQMLEGQPVGADQIARAASAASGAIDARDDRRASAGYRRTLARELTARCLLEIAELSERTSP
jgi:CO/xanthine dehydrogenase FAD-binding subunit